MKLPSPLPWTKTFGATPLHGGCARPRFRDCVLALLVLWVAARCPCAGAADDAFSKKLPARNLDSYAVAPIEIKARLPGPLIAPSEVWEPASSFDFSLPASPIYSATDFRPRKRTLFDADATSGNPYATPMLHTTTVWQRLSEYRSRDRVRLLTLWETPGSSVSLQAGKRGDPSLQWSSRVMNRGGATRGLLDRLLSVSFGSGGSSRNSPRSAGVGTAPVTKPLATPVTASVK